MGRVHAGDDDPRTFKAGYRPGTFRQMIDRPVPESRCQTVGTRIRPE